MQIKEKNTELINEIVQVSTDLSLTHFIFPINCPPRIAVLHRQCFVCFFLPSLRTINTCRLSEVPSSSFTDLFFPFPNKNKSQFFTAGVIPAVRVLHHSEEQLYPVTEVTK